jgi:hypothetical protein
MLRFIDISVFEHSNQRIYPRDEGKQPQRSQYNMEQHSGRACYAPPHRDSNKTSKINYNTE